MNCYQTLTKYFELAPFSTRSPHVHYFHLIVLYLQPGVERKMDDDIVLIYLLETDTAFSSYKTFHYRGFSLHSPRQTFVRSHIYVKAALRAPFNQNDEALAIKDINEQNKSMEQFIHTNSKSKVMNTFFFF